MWCDDILGLVGLLPDQSWGACLLSVAWTLVGFLPELSGNGQGCLCVSSAAPAEAELGSLRRPLSCVLDPLLFL